MLGNRISATWSAQLRLVAGGSCGGGYMLHICRRDAAGQHRLAVGHLWLVECRQRLSIGWQGLSKTMRPRVKALPRVVEALLQLVEALRRRSKALRRLCKALKRLRIALWQLEEILMELGDAMQRVAEYRHGMVMTCTRHSRSMWRRVTISVSRLRVSAPVLRAQCCVPSCSTTN